MPLSKLSRLKLIKGCITFAICIDAGEQTAALIQYLLSGTLQRLYILDTGAVIWYVGKWQMNNSESESQCRCIQPESKGLQ